MKALSQAGYTIAAVLAFAVAMAATVCAVDSCTNPIGQEVSR